MRPGDLLLTETMFPQCAGKKDFTPVFVGYLEVRIFRFLDTQLAALLANKIDYLNARNLRAMI